MSKFVRIALLATAIAAAALTSGCASHRPKYANVVPGGPGTEWFWRVPVSRDFCPTRDLMKCAEPNLREWAAAKCPKGYGTLDLGTTGEIIPIGATIMTGVIFEDTHMKVRCT